MIETKDGLDPRSPAGSSIAPRLPDRVRPSEGAPVSLELVGRLLRGLDARQRAAVTHGEGPLRVIAGPGTGKTRVVTRRIAWLIATKRARPAQILALTFTGRAADEMQGRVDQLMPYGYADTAIQTFHAFGDGLVREHALRLGLPPEPRLVTRSEAVALIRESLFGLDLKRYRPLGDPARFLGALVELFGRAKQEDVTPDEWSQFAMRMANDARMAEPADHAAREALAADQAELAAAFAAYQAMLGEAGAIDRDVGGFADDEREQLGLRGVRVLELIDEDEAEAALDLRPDIGVLPQQPHGEPDLVPEVDGASLAEHGLVGGEGGGQLGLIRGEGFTGGAVRGLRHPSVVRHAHGELRPLVRRHVLLLRPTEQ